MSRINVVVAATSPDIKAEGISEAIAQRSDMTLVESRVVAVQEVGTLLDAPQLSAHCALVLVGPDRDTEEIAAHWLKGRSGLVVLRVDIIEDLVRIAMRDAGLDSLLTALRELVEHAGPSPRERISQFQLRPSSTGGESSSGPATGPAEESARSSGDTARSAAAAPSSSRSTASTAASSPGGSVIFPAWRH